MSNDELDGKDEPDEPQLPIIIEPIYSAMLSQLNNSTYVVAMHTIFDLYG